MAKAPVETARIGPIRYRLKPEDNMLRHHQEYGEINSIAKHIRYDCGEAAARTLVHELIHGMRKLLTCTDEDDKEDEKATCQIESAMVSFVADNPALCHWLVAQIDKEINGNYSRSPGCCQGTTCGKQAGTCCDCELPVNT